MKLLSAIFFIICFPIFIFLTTILYTSDITPILKADLAKNNIYQQLSDQLGNLDTGDGNSALFTQFIQNKFTHEYLQKKVEKAMDDSDKWITGKSKKPPVISFKDVKDELNAQYPQLLPGIESAAQELKKQEEQNPQLMQQNPQAAKNLDMIASLAKSDFTIKLNKYLTGLKNFYTTVRIAQPILGILLALCLIALGLLNKSWHTRLKWVGITLLITSIWGYILAFSNVGIVALLSKAAASSSNHELQLSLPIILQLINHYVDSYVNNQKIASLALLIVSIISLVGMFFTKTTAPAVVQPKKTTKKRS